MTDKITTNIKLNPNDPVVLRALASKANITVDRGRAYKNGNLSGLIQTFADMSRHSLYGRQLLKLIREFQRSKYDFCAWCVGNEEAAKRTAKGQTSGICKKHKQEYQRQLEELKKRRS